MTHAADNANMISAAVHSYRSKHDVNSKGVFNCATTSLITYDEIAELCAKAAGADPPQIVHYDPKDFDIPKGFFPFRDTPFYVCVDKATKKLGFQPKHQLS